MVWRSGYIGEGEDEPKDSPKTRFRLLGHWRGCIWETNVRKMQ